MKKLFSNSTIFVLIILFALSCKRQIKTGANDDLALFKYEHEGVTQFDTEEEKEAHRSRIGWWKEAKLGLFLHWGIYSVPEGSWNGKKTMGNGEWVMSALKIPVKEYEKFATQFNPENFDAEAWVKLAYESGAGYIAITAKHHDGFAMYHSKISKYNVVDATPFKRDPMKELAVACRKYGVKLCFYYSQDIDWHHPGGHGNNWDYTQEDFDANVDKYYEEKCLPQIRELCTNYGDIGAFWFDTPRSIAKHWSEKIYDVIRELQPNCIMNSRLGNNTGDYLIAGERGFPGWKIPGVDWEHCQTINKSWGYNANLENEEYWLPTDMLLRNLACMTSYGGNYLLNIGPDKNGNFPEKAVRVFSRFESWMDVNRESIYKASETPFPQGQTWGAVTSKEGKIFLHVFEWPENNTLVLSGLNNKVISAKIKEGDLKLDFKQNKNKTAPQLIITLPDSAPDEINTVIELEINGSAETSQYAIQNSVTWLLSIDGHLFNGEDGKLQTQAFFNQKGTYKIEVHSLQNFWGRGTGWTGGNQEGTLTIDESTVAFKMKADSIYKKPWFSYSTMVKSEVGKISISKQGLKTVFMDGINLYRG
ncbi:MAG: alpha-L-fucosidase [Bacteroidetes bacterium]|nr:alpha-L-fucosidase [Bacteroidota bacterium]